MTLAAAIRAYEAKEMDYDRRQAMLVGLILMAFAGGVGGFIFGFIAGYAAHGH